MKEYTPEQQARIDAFIKKAEQKKCLPESYFARLEVSISLMAWKGFASLKAYGMSINPFTQLQYLVTRQVPEAKQSKDMLKHASGALLGFATLGDIKHAKNCLTELQADVNYQDEEGCTPLFRAISRKRLGMAEMLLENGADATIPNKGHLTPVLLACKCGFSQAIPLFVKYGVDLNKPVKYRYWNKYYLGWENRFASPITIATVNGHVDVCEKLIQYGANPDVKVTNKLTLMSCLKIDREGKKQFCSSEIHDFFDSLPQPQKIIQRNQSIVITDKSYTRE